MSTQFSFDANTSSPESIQRGSRAQLAQRGLSQELWSQLGRIGSNADADSLQNSSLLKDQLPGLSFFDDENSNVSRDSAPSTGQGAEHERSFRDQLKHDESELRHDIGELRHSGDGNPDVVQQLHQLKKELMQALRNHDPHELKQVSRELDQISNRIGNGGSGSGTGGGDGGSGGGSGSGSGGGDGGSGGGSGSGGGEGGSGNSGQEGFTATFNSISDMQKYAADGLNFSNIRNLGTGVTWGNSIEKTPGQYDFTALNKWTSAANSLGKGYIFTIDDPPLADCPNGGQMFGKFTNNGVPSQQSFDNFVTALAKNSAAQKADGQGGITDYELWNEFSSKNFWGGTPEQMAQQTYDAYSIIKQYDPTAKILAPSVTGTGSEASQNYYSQYLGALQSMHDSNPSLPYPPFDAMSFHFRTNNGQPASDMESNMQDMYNVVSQYGLQNVPWCDTEDGPQIGASLPTAQDVGNYYSEKQALYDSFVTSHDLSASDLPGMNVYMVESNSDIPGLTDGNGNLTQAATDWNQMASWLQSGTPGETQIDGDVYQVPITLADGQNETLVWDSAGNANFDTSGYTQYTDMNGTVHQITPGESIPIGLGPIFLS